MRAKGGRSRRADLSDGLADYGTRPAQDHYHGRATFYGGLEMPKLILTTTIILAGISPGYARGMHSIGRAL
jgi:hypothetical protein